MSAPRTTTGVTFLALLRTQDRLMLPDAKPVDWAHGIRAIEADAAAPLREALLAIIAATDNATDRGGPTSQWLVRVGGLRSFHDAIEKARSLVSEPPAE